MLETYILHTSSDIVITFSNAKVLRLKIAFINNFAISHYCHCLIEKVKLEPVVLGEYFFSM